MAADPKSYVAEIIQANRDLINAIEKVRLYAARMDSDGSYISGVDTNSGVTSGTLASMREGWGQVIFTFDSGAPTQKSKMFGVM